MVAQDFYSVIRVDFTRVREITTIDKVNLCKEMHAGNAGASQDITAILLRPGHFRNPIEMHAVLDARYGLPLRTSRAIAQYLQNVASVRINREKQLEVGIKKARWIFGACGVGGVPCTGHQEADRKIYLIAQGLDILGENVLPGAEFDCGCIWESIIPGYNSRS